ncbi:MAG: flagellar protein FlaG [Clostridiales bacterium]|nr:flagellar protein FlaG [Clostridiales bacterium]
MKVQGVDPMILNRIQDQTNKQAVQETKQTKISNEQEPKKETRQEAVDQDTLVESVQKLNKAAEAFNIQLRFSIDKEDNQVVVLVIDKVNQKVIRQIPPTKVMDMLTQMQYMVGVLVDQMI